MAQLIYIDEPKDSPRRMACRKCKAKPGAKCTNSQGVEHNIYCTTRWNDLKIVQRDEQRIADWNKSVSKAKES